MPGIPAIRSILLPACCNTGITPIYNTQEVANVANGTYTVVAVNADPTCPILPDTATVEIDQVHPPVNITLVSPMTYCDPANGNGVASADVNGSTFGFIFEWYEESLSNTPAFFTGSQATSLKATTYFVKAIDQVSGCDGSNSITIPLEPMIIAIPDIDVLSNHTDCQEPNGALSASVGGNTGDYIFQWYDGTSVKNSPDAQGEIYHDLAEGTYTVTATDRISGCVSPPASKPILRLFTLPEFTIDTKATECSLQNGTAEIVILNNSDIETVEWSVDEFTAPFSTDFSINGLTPGSYIVKATSSLNCSDTLHFTIKTEIAVYNGVSANNDNMNDYFDISCIENFPTNNVRIFNRSGTLVYEVKGYNNQDVMFNGVSNRGVNVLGKDLPEGTYFYIIDKGDGSVPKTGYLELLR